MLDVNVAVEYRLVVALRSLLPFVAERRSFDTPTLVVVGLRVAYRTPCACPRSAAAFRFWFAAVEDVAG